MSATATDLRSRLGELTLRDAHRLKRRLDRVRRHPDPAALRKLEADVERAEARVAKLAEIQENLALIDRKLDIYRGRIAIGDRTAHPG